MLTRTLTAVSLVVGLGVGIFACTESESTSGSAPSVPPPPPPPPPPMARESLPAPAPISNRPQASGRDLPQVEVAGQGTVGRVTVANDSSSSIIYHAGSWFEPKDGSYQRMMVLDTRIIDSGDSADIPTACMQFSKSVPATGLRFFSEPKSAGGSLQSCQTSCLGRSSQSAVQSCIWDCEKPRIEWTIEDECADGRDAHFRFFQIRSGNVVRVWPSSSRVYIAPFGEPVTATLDPSQPELGGKICYGAEAGNRYWGIGLDGNQSCDNCCLSVPTAGTITESHRLICGQAGGAAGVQALAKTPMESGNPPDNR